MAGVYISLVSGHFEAFASDHKLVSSSAEEDRVIWKTPKANDLALFPMAKPQLSSQRGLQNPTCSERQKEI